METLSKTPITETTREKEHRPPPAPSGAVSDSLSLPSYKEYPAHRPLVKAPVHHTPHRRTHQSCYPSKPRKAFPETSSDAILSALRNLQEKIRRLELERGHTELRLHTVGRDATRTYPRSGNVAQGQNDQPDGERERGGQSGCNQALVSHLAAAESRCVKLEQQLDHMRRMLRHAKADRTSLLKQQVVMETALSGNQQANIVCERSQLVKLERLEQEYLRLTHTQNNAEVKIRLLEMKLQEEEHQRKLVQDKTNQLQTGLEANRMLLQSVSPHLSNRPSKEKGASSKAQTSHGDASLRPSRQPSPHTQPHYRLDLRDVPFIAGTSVSCSHSVRANVQSVLSLLKQHQPYLCNRRVLSNDANHRERGRRRQSDASSSSSSSSASGEELSELLQALQEELGLMTSEQDELTKQLEASVSEQERKDLQKEQERLLLKMERKGEQIRKLYKHKTQIKELRREANCRPKSGDEVKVTPTVFTRGRSAGPVKVKPGERSKRNLRLLRDMKALQTSLRT